MNHHPHSKDAGRKHVSEALVQLGKKTPRFRGCLQSVISDWTEMAIWWLAAGSDTHRHDRIATQHTTGQTFVSDMALAVETRAGSDGCMFVHN